MSNFFLCRDAKANRCPNFAKNSNSLSPSTAKTVIGQPFIELITVESTNIYAMDQLKANLAAHGTVYFAHDQTAGKGQRGKSWQTQPGTHIAISVVLDCSFLSLPEQFNLNLMSALAVHDFFSKYAGEESSVKWPNDLYWRDRKAGGILIENIFTGTHWKCAVVGIGININQVEFDPAIRNPVSLKQVTGKQYDVLTLAKQLHQRVIARFEELDKKPVEELLAEYNQHLFCINEKIKLKKDNAVFETVVKSVTENGLMITRDSLERTWNFGEVEWILK